MCNAEKKFDILEAITSLVNNSLLRQEDISNSEPRFGMLETMRAHALQYLEASSEMDSLRAGHAQYYGNIILNQMSFEMYSPAGLYWLNWLEREHDNIRATLTWSLFTPQRIELAAGLVWSLEWFWYRRGYFSEGRMWSKRALESPAIQEDSKPRAIVLLSSGAFATWQGEPETGLAQIQEGLRIVQRLEDEELMPIALMTNAVTFINMGRDSAAQPLLKEARTLFEEQDQPYLHIATLVHLGNVELGLGNPDQARAPCMSKPWSRHARSTKIGF